MLQLTASAPEEIGGGEYKVVLVATSTSGGGQKGGAQPGVLVRFYRQGREIGQEMTEGDGRAVLEVPGLTPGTHLFEAQVDGPPLVKSSRPVSIPRPASRPTPRVKQILLRAIGDEGRYVLSALCADENGIPIAGARGRVFGLDADPRVAVAFVTNSDGRDDGQLLLDFKEAWRSGFVEIGGIREDFRLSGPSRIRRPPDVPKKYRKNPLKRWGFRFGTDNNVRCVTFWLLAIVCLAVNIWLSTSSPAADPLVEANRRAAAFIKGESESFFSFSIPFRWKAWAWWLVFCIVYTPIALSDEAAWAWEAAKRKILEDRGGKETAPTPKTTTSSTTTAAPANTGGEKHLTWRDYVRWEFIISLVTIFFEKMVSGAFRRKET